MATGGLAPLDWLVVGSILVVTTAAGRLLAGRQTSTSDFFLAGHRLPWYAVSASIIATEISAVTFVSLPSVVYRPGGNMTYLQLGLVGAFLGRCLIAWWILPAYYSGRFFSPYDYMGARLGEPVRRLSTVLFSFGGILAQSSRVYLTALVLEVVLQQELSMVEAATGLRPLWSAVLLITAVAVVWTCMGGIAAVVWTDAVLFLLLVAGAVVSLGTVAANIDGGLSAVSASGWDAGKFRLWDFAADPTRAYTFWAALFGATIGTVAHFGTDQLLAQRLFCCRSLRAARWAMVTSGLSVAITFTVALVGVALWAYYGENPLVGAALEAVRERPDRVFPLFILEVIPAGLRGLVLAGILAAAISSLDSILAALSQTTVALLTEGGFWRKSGVTAGLSLGSLALSRLFVVVWGIVLALAAIAIDPVAARYDAILDLALAMAGYTGGAVLAGFVLASRPLGTDGRGYLWSAPLSVLVVFSVVWHQTWALVLCFGAGVLVLGSFVVARRRQCDRRYVAQCALLALGVVGTLVLARYAVTAEGEVLAFPWYVPIGLFVASSWGWGLSRPSTEVAGRSDA